MPSQDQTPIKRALLVGVDHYYNLKEKYWLNGCVNDAVLVGSMLTERFGFDVENTRYLLAPVEGDESWPAHEKPTREAILAGMDQLVADTNPGDVVVMHYSGHGSQMTDREGDEPDGKDETIMPCDSGRGSKPNLDITDDEIYLRLLALGEKTQHITLIFDCCHSGTITRDAFGATARAVPDDERPVEELPPSPLSEEELAILRGEGRKGGPSGWLPLETKYVLMAGCRDEERSFEHKRKIGDKTVTHGALTYYLTRALQKTESGMTYRDVFELVNAEVTSANSQQHPQMEGTLDKEVFGIRQFEPATFLRVTSREGDSVTLASGAAQGVTVGSKFGIHASGSKKPTAGTHLGDIEITDVGAVTSTARITNETSDGAVAENTRAFETHHAYGDMRLPVWLSESGDALEGAEAHESLQEAIEKSEQLDLMADKDGAAIAVYWIDDRDSATDDDPVPQLGALHAPTWAAVGETGELVMPTKSPDEWKDVLANLHTIARYRNALSLDNPDPESQLKGKVTLELLRKQADGEWVTAEPETSGGGIVYEEGEQIAFRIESHHTEPVFINLVDFGLSGAVTPLYPPRGVKGERLVPGDKPVEIGKRGEFKMGLPKNFPFVDTKGANTAIEGIETVKLFVTANEADFNFLRQGGTRGADDFGADRSSRGAFENLLRTATTGTRDIVETAIPVNEDDWATVMKPFIMRAKSSKGLKSDGQPVNMGAVSLQTAGLEGTVTSYDWTSPRAQEAELTTGVLSGALAAAGIQTQQTVEIADAKEVGDASRSTDFGEPALELSAPDPGDNYGQMVMSTDESGVVGWHFAEEEAEGGRDLGGSRSYVIRRSVGELDAPPSSRGLVGAVGKKFLKVMAFPLLDPVFGMVGDYFASRWEEKRRPYGIRTFTAADYAEPSGGAVDGAMWDKLAEGPALLFIHGTFSRAHHAFSGLPAAYLQALHDAYDGRVFAFDHPTISVSPRKNIEWLLEHMPDGRSLNLDIVCHSRGGLVSRVLSEKQGDLALGSRQVKVRKVVFAGSPNGGTAMADAEHIGNFLDSYTNMLNFLDLLPDNGVTDVLDGVITVAKQLAVGAYKGLEGIRSMKPGGDFEKWLASGRAVEGTHYFALASNFQPSSPGLKDFAMDRVADKIFGGGANDLVVPASSVFEGPGKGLFPITDKHVFGDQDDVGHSGYFANAKAREVIQTWLS